VYHSHYFPESTLFPLRVIPAIHLLRRARLIPPQIGKVGITSETKISELLRKIAQTEIKGNKPSRGRLIAVANPTNAIVFKKSIIKL